MSSFAFWLLGMWLTSSGSDSFMLSSFFLLAATACDGLRPRPPGRRDHGASCFSQTIHLRLRLGVMSHPHPMRMPNRRLLRI